MPVDAEQTISCPGTSGTCLIQADSWIQVGDVNTYLDDPKDVVTLAVKMASLPDGTNYVQQTVLDATAKQLQVTTTNSNYQQIGGQ